MDEGEDLMWICEAFGIPDVNYQWFRNGEVWIFLFIFVLTVKINHKNVFQIFFFLNSYLIHHL